jgi:hypothetical protein
MEGSWCFHNLVVRVWLRSYPNSRFCRAGIGDYSTWDRLSWSVWPEEIYAAETGNAQLKSLNPADGPCFRKGQ